MTNLPQLTAEIKGSSIVSNAQQMLISVKEVAEQERARELKTDQDFKDREDFIKVIKITRAELKTKSEEIEKNFESLAEFKTAKNEIDSTLQKLQSDFEKQVKAEKERRKTEFFTEAEQTWQSYVNHTNQKIQPVHLQNVAGIRRPDFLKVSKGKSKLDSIKSAVYAEIEAVQIEINAKVEIIVENLDVFAGVAPEHKQLFSDLQTIAQLPAEQFQILVNQRVETFRQQETQRLEEERKRIQQEEQEKAQVQAENKMKKADASFEENANRVHMTQPQEPEKNSRYEPYIAKSHNVSDIEQDKQYLQNFRTQLNQIRPKLGEMKTDEGIQAVQEFTEALRVGFNGIVKFLEVK